MPIGKQLKDRDTLMYLQRELQQMIARVKPDYETNLALTYAHSNTNQIFNKSPTSRLRTTEMSYNDITASNDSDKAQIFNNYFYSVFSCNNPATTEVNLDTKPTSGILNYVVTIQTLYSM